LAVLAQANDP